MKNSFLSKLAGIAKVAAYIAVRTVAAVLVAPFAVIALLCGNKTIVESELYNHYKAMARLQSWDCDNAEAIIGSIAGTVVVVLAFGLAFPVSSFAAATWLLISSISGLYVNAVYGMSYPKKKVTTETVTTVTVETDAVPA